MNTSQDMNRNPVGRPSEFTKDMADHICAELSEGKSLRKVCSSDAMPDKTTVFRWLREHEEFRIQYAQAKEESADAKLEELEDIGDEALHAVGLSDPKAANAVVQAHRLKADNIKWYMSKLKPKKYGDKLDLTSKGERIYETPKVVSDIRGRNAGTEPEATTSSTGNK